MHHLVQEHIPLKLYNTFGIGGFARYFAEAGTIEEFLELYKWGIANQYRVFVLGMGSNVVFPDEGFEGLVIRYTASRFTFQQNIAVVEAALPLSRLILEAEKMNLGGIESLFGIPGSVGGAIFNNAGAHGIQIGNFLESALVFEVPREVELSAMRLLGRGRLTLPEPKIVKPEYFDFAYRYTNLQSSRAIVLSATLELQDRPSEDVKRLREEVAKWRSEKQPVGRSAGSFFKNPSQTNSAGYLLDQVGAKGMKEGDIIVSEQHANFLINRGKGTFEDLQKLSEKLEKLVWKKFGVKLEREVEFVV